MFSLCSFHNLEIAFKLLPSRVVNVVTGLESNTHQVDISAVLMLLDFFIEAEMLVFSLWCYMIFEHLRNTTFLSLFVSNNNHSTVIF